MIKAIFRIWKYHLSDHIFLYLLTILAFIIGSAVGAYTIKTLGIYELRELVEYLDYFLKGMPVWQINSIIVAQDAILNNLKFILLIWFLGLTVIGIPIILLVIAAKGFILGFTVGFLVIEKEMIGLFISIFGVLPQNLFYIPGLIVCGVAAITFSLSLFKGTLNRKKLSISKMFVNYLLLLIFICLLSLMGGLLEGYFAPTAMKLIITYFQQ